VTSPPHALSDGKRIEERALTDYVVLLRTLLSATVGVGEREGRVFSSLVRSRHMNLSHGMGRSGDLLAQQPKAAGSSLLLTLTHALTLHAIKLAGLTEVKQVLLLPVATGMSIVLTLTAIHQQHPKYLQAQAAALQHAQSIVHSISTPSSSAAAPAPSSFSSPSSPLYVLWSRIDQKTCLKSIFAAGLVPVVIDLKQEGDQLVTDLDAIQTAMERIGAENILAVVSTTSCFAPRAPDRSVAR
jgi:O-phospho-L-seryl-tRNASec:L-selenocysteinyl-tRNA synthase